MIEVVLRNIDKTVILYDHPCIHKVTYVGRNAHIIADNGTDVKAIYNARLNDKHATITDRLNELTYTQVEDYIDNNVTELNSAKAFLKKL